MLIHIEETPNPASLKFIPGQVVMLQGIAEFSAESPVINSLLARSLLKIKGVKSIFFGYDFISVTRDETLEWQVMKPQVVSVIVDHYAAGYPIIDNDNANKADHVRNTHDNTQDAAIVNQIIEILDKYVRPAVARDGGDITFAKFEDGVVYLHMRGACAGCPSSTATLKAGVENMLKHYIPEVKATAAL